MIKTNLNSQRVEHDLPEQSLILAELIDVLLKVGNRIEMRKGSGNVPMQRNVEGDGEFLGGADWEAICWGNGEQPVLKNQLVICPMLEENL